MKWVIIPRVADRLNTSVYNESLTPKTSEAARQPPSGRARERVEAPAPQGARREKMSGALVCYHPAADGDVPGRMEQLGLIPAPGGP